jgi:hypothetical protein
MDKVLTDAPPTVTDSMMREFGKELADCTPALDRLGSTTDRLQPVSDLAERACAEYENTAKRFAAAKDRGFDALSKGSDLFAQAEAKGFEIKAAAQ